MKRLLALALTAALVGCQTAPKEPPVRTVTLDDHNREVEYHQRLAAQQEAIYRRQMEQQELMLRRMNERMEDLQGALARQQRMLRNTDCKVICF